jgi:hypothetical protein
MNMDSRAITGAAGDSRYRDFDFDWGFGVSAVYIPGFTCELYKAQLKTS